MEQPIRWPEGEFTLPAALSLNPALPPAVMRQKLSTAIAAKAVVQARKGNGIIQGTFKAVKADAETKVS